MGVHTLVFALVFSFLRKNFANVYCSPVGGLNRYRHIMILFYEAGFGPKPADKQTKSADSKSNRLYRGGKP